MAHKLIVVYVPLDTKYAISETFPRKKKKTHSPIKKNVLQRKHTKKLKSGLVASYDIRPRYREGLFWFWHFINLSLTYELTYSPGTHTEPRWHTKTSAFEHWLVQQQHLRHHQGKNLTAGHFITITLMPWGDQIHRAKTNGYKQRVGWLEVQVFVFKRETLEHQNHIKIPQQIWPIILPLTSSCRSLALANCGLLLQME